METIKLINEDLPVIIMQEFILIYLKEIISVNKGHVIGYGSDIYTEKATDIFKEHFGMH